MKKTSRAQLGLLGLLGLAALLLLTACSKVTLENYNKLQMGQTYEQTVALLGDPARCDEVIGVRQCQWGSEQKGVSVSFVAGKVVLFAATNLK